jgi:sulfopropanediol 3-dehydrogenase
MAIWLKTAKSAEERAQDDAKVRETVECALDGIARRGDAAVREMSRSFDRWEPESFRLSESEIEACLAQLSEQDLDDIRFAQEQVRGFALKQKACLLDLEVETLPGVILGHKQIPVASVGCYVPGGKYPLLASVGRDR